MMKPASKFLSTMIATGAITMAAALISSTAQARGDAPDSGQVQSTQVPGFWRIAVGDTLVTALFDGPIHIPTAKLKGASATQINQALAAMFVPQDKTGVQTAVNGFVINQAGRLTLIDAGAAQCFGPTLGNLQNNMRAAGIDPKKDADFWLDEAVAAKAPAQAQASFKFARDAVAPYKAAGRFKTFDDGASPVQGIMTVPSHGHTPGHTSYLVKSGDSQMMIWGDIVHSHSMQFARPEVALEFDSDSKAAIATRRRLMAQAASQKLWVAGAHLPFPGIGHVAPAGKAWRWVPAEYSPVEIRRPSN